MRVTKFQYPLELSLIKRLDLMIARCTQKNPKRDAVLLIEGAEGEGKSGLSVALGYYIAEKTNRNFSHENIFFDVKKMIKFLQDNDGQIAIWDEPALQSLSGDALSSIVKDLKRMLMMCRNKRHFILINMTYFTEFGNYIVWQRPLAMIHVYSRNELQAGRFIFIRKKKLERLWLDWKRKRERNYVKYRSKRCRGTFPDVLNPDYKYNVLSEFNFKEYEKNKNESIASIGGEKKKLNEKDIRNRIIIDAIINSQKLEKKIPTQTLSIAFGLSQRSIELILQKNKENEAQNSPLYNNMGSEEETIDVVPKSEEKDNVVPKND